MFVEADTQSIRHGVEEALRDVEALELEMRDLREEKLRGWDSAVETLRRLAGLPGEHPQAVV